MDEHLPTPGESQALAVLERLAGFSGPVVEKLQRAMNGTPPSALAAAENDADDTAQRERAWKPDLRFRSLIEKLPVVTFMASLDDTVQELYVSPQIETLLGFTQEEWLDNPILWMEQLHPDDWDRWIEAFARTCSEGAHFRAEYRLFARDGRVVWVQGECQLIRDDDGRPLFLQGIAFDITHLKKAAMVEEARLAAEAANEAKSEFLARMSHEIRTPLNGVVGMIDLLAATSLTDTQHRYAQLAHDAADSLLTVINDILDFSKIEAGKVEIEAIEFDLHGMIEDLSVLLAPLAAKKGLAIVSFIRPQVPRRLVGDPNRVRQVLTNLITNAVKFTERGQVSIRAARIENASDGALQARIEVQDTGIGIPPDRLDRLFKSFSQVDTSTTRKFGGTGLGLVICKRLVELMGGEIGIKSEVGQGTTFWFTLKLGQVGEQTILHEPAESLRSVRVLAVESEQRLGQNLVEQLDGRLSRPPVIVDQEQLLPALRQAVLEGHPFDVVLIAFGPQNASLAATIPTDPSLGRAKLIAITSLDDQTDMTAILRAGYAARVQRPLTQSQLIDTIASATVLRPAGAVETPVVQGSSHQSLKGLHVLVAEDNDMNQFVTQQTLLRVGCTCDIVGDGAQAIEAVGKRQYAAVLMDCQMPDVDGLEATRRIRAREYTAGSARVPIIALTAEAVAGDREKCLAAGMDGYVSKPINAKDLFAELASVVRRELPSQIPAQPANAGEMPVPLDVESMFVRCMRDPAFATRMLEKFGLRALEDIERLRLGIASGDATGAGRVAHNLKSVAAHVSAEKLAGIAAEIEQAGVRRDLQFIERQLELLNEEARRCISYIPRAIELIAKAHASSPSPVPLR